MGPQIKHLQLINCKEIDFKTVFWYAYSLVFIKEESKGPTTEVAVLVSLTV